MCLVWRVLNGGVLRVECEVLSLKSIERWSVESIKWWSVECGMWSVEFGEY